MMAGFPLAAVGDHVAQVVFWCLILIGSIIVLFLGIWYYRRRWLAADQPDSGTQTPWTFDDLRRMKEQGQITEEEYRVLRANLIAAFQNPKKSSLES